MVYDDEGSEPIVIDGDGVGVVDSESDGLAVCFPDHDKVGVAVQYTEVEKEGVGVELPVDLRHGDRDVLSVIECVTSAL